MQSLTDHPPIGLPAGCPGGRRALRCPSIGLSGMPACVAPLPLHQAVRCSKLPARHDDTGSHTLADRHHASILAGDGVEMMGGEEQDGQTRTH